MPEVKPTNRLVPRLRVYHGRDIAAGPGKIELLAAVKETGSIVEAARRMEMSYMRAWKLIQTMNACFKEPLIVAARGGKQGGGTGLTPTGEEVLQLYSRMEAEARSAVESDWTRLRRLLRA